MPIFVGGIDPIKLCEGILNALISKGVITKDEAEQIVEKSKLNR